MLPFVKASLLSYKKEEKSFEEVFEQFNSVNLNINSRPWHYVIWNPIEKKMIMNSSSLTYLLLIYLYNRNLLSPKELNKLKEGYASKISYEDVDNVLEGI